MKKLLVVLAALFLMVGIICPAGLQAEVMDAQLQSLLDSAGPNDEIRVIVTFTDRTPVEGIEGETRRARRTRIINVLRQKAEFSQAPLRAYLEESRRAKQMRQLWLINGMAVTAIPEVIREMSSRQGVERITMDVPVSAPIMTYSETISPTWNLQAVGAEKLWALGYTGKGVVVANLDSGVDIAHPALAGSYRGGTNSWYDATGESSTPYDPEGHGTGTMSIMVGGVAGGRQIGMAPGAKWIAAKVFDRFGSAWASDIHQGFQWLLDPDGNPLTDDAPDVVNCSWGDPTLLDVCDPEFRTDIQALRAAGIAVIFAAGNSGPYPWTSTSPANYPESLAVGSIDRNLAVDVYSSRGPSACGPNIYPQLLAPGVDILACDLSQEGQLPDALASVSGTSFAAPHVAGAIALLMEAFPNLTVNQIQSALTRTAVRSPHDPVPAADNHYGYGLLNVFRAYESLRPPVPRAPSAPGVQRMRPVRVRLTVEPRRRVLFPGAQPVLNAIAKWGTGQYLYRFWVRANGEWSMLRDYSEDPQWIWSTEGLSPGRYIIRVEVKNVDSQKDVDARAAMVFVVRKDPSAMQTIGAALAGVVAQ